MAKKRATAVLIEEDLSQRDLVALAILIALVATRKAETNADKMGEAVEVAFAGADAFAARRAKES